MSLKLLLGGGWSQWDHCKLRVSYVDFYLKFNDLGRRRGMARNGRSEALCRWIRRRQDQSAAPRWSESKTSGGGIVYQNYIGRDIRVDERQLAAVGRKLEVSNTARSEVS